MDATKWQILNTQKLSKAGCVHTIHKQVVWVCAVLMNLSKMLTKQVPNHQWITVKYYRLLVHRYFFMARTIAATCK